LESACAARQEEKKRSKTAPQAKYYFLAGTGIMFLIALACTSLSVASKPPNLLFLMADQMRSDMVGYTGTKGSVTPALDKLCKEGAMFQTAYTSVPHCTPARTALLTGRSPWNHGDIGGANPFAHSFPYEMPKALKAAGYTTISIGKDHFGWNRTAGHGIDHGYTTTLLYDGLGNGFPSGGEFDNYDQWFQAEMPGKDPMATGLDWNTWHGKAYVYDEYYHPTAWVGRTAIAWLNKTDTTDEKAAPWFLKVSFHRPHSPYDPPARLLNATTVESLPPIVTGGNWDSRYRGMANESTSAAGCGPTGTTGATGKDAWCGLMPVKDSDLARRAYHASVRFVDEWIGHIVEVLETNSLMVS
jgi:arylsulfatase A-like enzyme